MSKIDPTLRTKRAYAHVSQLKNIGPSSNSKIKYLLESSPFDGDDESPPTGDWVIRGRIFPKSEIYTPNGLPIKIIIGAEYPFKPPKVMVEGTIYHPNVDQKGEICTNLLSSISGWTPTTSFVQVIEDVTDIINNPSTDLIKHPEAASLFNTDRAEYNRIAAQVAAKNLQPRE